MLDYTWPLLPLKTDGGQDYIYYVVESNLPSNYTKVEDGLTVTNTYTSSLNDVTATKAWVGGSERPEVTFQLYRKVGNEAGEPVGTPVKLDGIVDVNEQSAWNYTWNNLPTHRQMDGLLYIYYVIETVIPTNYSPDTVDDLTVINTYKSPKINVTGTKEWVNGPQDRPTIELQLYRDGVALGDSVELLSGDTTHTWTGLDRTDSDGNDYIYTVDEINVPDNYEKVAIGLKVTNTYVSPKIDHRY